MQLLYGVFDEYKKFRNLSRKIGKSKNLIGKTKKYLKIYVKYLILENYLTK